MNFQQKNKFKATAEITAILSVIDYDSKAVLSKFKIPSQRLQPFQQYHLELVDKVWERNAKPVFLFVGDELLRVDQTEATHVPRKFARVCPLRDERWDQRQWPGRFHRYNLLPTCFYWSSQFLAIFRPLSDILHYRESYMKDRARNWMDERNPRNLSFSSSKKSLSLKVRIGVLSTSNLSTCSAKVRDCPPTHRLDFLKECFVARDKNSSSILKNAQAQWCWTAALEYYRVGQVSEAL